MSDAISGGRGKPVKRRFPLLSNKTYFIFCDRASGPGRTNNEPFGLREAEMKGSGIFLRVFFCADCSVPFAGFLECMRPDGQQMGGDLDYGGTDGLGKPSPVAGFDEQHPAADRLRFDRRRQRACQVIQ